jgi:hypothetical protein
MMPSNLSKWLYLLVPSAIYGVGIFCALGYGTDWAEKQTWAVVLTGAVIIWYTWETMLLRRIAFAQRELQLRPFVIFQKEGGRFVIENIGNGAALNVRLGNITMEAPGTKMEIRFPNQLPLLKPKTIADVEIEVRINGEKADSLLAENLDPKYATIDIEVHIHFSNLEGKGYSLIEVISPKTLSMKGFRGEPTL